nr:MAG TPA: hypothetical protein [Caudoviricetes sp.]
MNLTILLYTKPSRPSVLGFTLSLIDLVYQG